MLGNFAPSGDRRGIQGLHRIAQHGVRQLTPRLRRAGARRACNATRRDLSQPPYGGASGRPERFACCSRCTCRWPPLRRFSAGGPPASWRLALRRGVGHSPIMMKRGATPTFGHDLVYQR